MLESEGVQNSQCRCPETGVISCGHKFFLPVKVLSVVFRGKFLDALEQAFKKHKLTLAGQLTPLQSPAEFAALLHAAAHGNWVVTHSLLWPTRKSSPHTVAGSVSFSSANQSTLTHRSQRWASLSTLPSWHHAGSCNPQRGLGALGR